MVSAEQLLDLVIFWMGHREECAESLSLAAGEVRSVGEGQGAMRERAKLLDSSSSVRDARLHDQKGSQICSDIQQLFEQLKEQSASEQPKDASRLVLEELLQTNGKRSGFTEDELNFESLIRTDEWAPRIDRILTTNLLKIMAFFGLSVEDEGLKGVLSEGLKETEKNTVRSVKMDTTESTTGGMETFPFCAAVKWEEQLRWCDDVTDLSQSLRVVALQMMAKVEELRTAFRCISEAFAELKDVQECIVDPECVCQRTKLLQYAQEHCRGRRTKEQSEDFEKPSRKQAAYEASAENQYEAITGNQAPRWGTRGHSQLMMHAVRMCQDEDLRAWLQEEGNTSAFLGLVDLFHMMRMRLARERRRSRSSRGRVIDIIFVAHGSITGQTIGSGMLLPLPSLLDVVLYQPWNCTIDATVAYGIAAGSIEPGSCHFICDPSCPDRSNHNHNHQPSLPSSTWNHLSENYGPIPEIYLSPLNAPHDAAWNYFKVLRRNHRNPDHDRVVIPFIFPRLRGARVPFSVVTLALSLVLKFSGMRARLHLAACLGRTPGTQLDLNELAGQYCVAPDNTMMVSKQFDPPTEEDDRELYQRFKDLFG